MRTFTRMFLILAVGVFVATIAFGQADVILTDDVTSTEVATDWADIATVALSHGANANDAYPLNTTVTLLAQPPRYCSGVTWSGVDSQNDRFATVKMNADRFVTVQMCR